MKRKALASEAAARKSNAKEKGLELEFEAFLNLSRRRPTFPHSYPCSIIGPTRLNFRVRDGNGCDPRGITTRNLLARANRRELNNRIWLALQVRLFIERTVTFWLCVFPKDGLGKFYD